MPANLLDGSRLANHMKSKIAERVQLRTQQGLPTPGLAVILVGNNPASDTYVRNKQKACEAVGIHSHCYRLPENVTQQALGELIDQCNQDPKTHGILLQLPLPMHINGNDLLERIEPLKDVDGFHPYNLGRLSQQRALMRPCTSYGVMKLLEHAKIDLIGKHAVVVGASNIVGRPMALELLSAQCTVTICHRHTQHLAQHVQDADLLAVGIGKPGIIQSNWIKPNAIVIDIGFSRLANGSFVGDIEFESAQQRASWITPVPGGVGPMTIATLLENTVLAAELQEQSGSTTQKQ